MDHSHRTLLSVKKVIACAFIVINRDNLVINLDAENKCNHFKLISFIDIKCTALH